MPSFDIVVETDLAEVDNAVNQARKELAQRYDFRGSKSRIDWEKGTYEIVLLGEDDYRLSAVLDMLQSKLFKRGVSIKNLTVGTAEDAAESMRRQRITLAKMAAQIAAMELPCACPATPMPRVNKKANHPAETNHAAPADDAAPDGPAR